MIDYPALIEKFKRDGKDRPEDDARSLLSQIRRSLSSESFLLELLIAAYIQEVGGPDGISVWHIRDDLGNELSFVGPFLGESVGFSAESRKRIDEYVQVYCELYYEFTSIPPAEAAVWMGEYVRFVDRPDYKNVGGETE